MRQFKTSAAKIPDNAIGVLKACDDAVSCDFRLFVTRKQGCIQPQPTHGIQEFCPVARLPHCRCRHRNRLGNTHQFRNVAEPGERFERCLHRLWVKPAGRNDLPAKPGHHFFVEQHRRRTCRAIEHDQPDRVRSDIDHRMTRRRPYFLRLKLSFGTADALSNEAPRPESDGFVMK